MSQPAKPKQNIKIKLSMPIRILLLAALILLPFILYIALHSPVAWLKMVLFGVILALMALIAFLG